MLFHVGDKTANERFWFVRIQLRLFEDDILKHRGQWRGLRGRHLRLTLRVRLRLAVRVEVHCWWFLALHAELILTFSVELRLTALSNSFIVARPFGLALRYVFLVAVGYRGAFARWSGLLLTWKRLSQVDRGRRLYLAHLVPLLLFCRFWGIVEEGFCVCFDSSFRKICHMGRNTRPLS